jgi:hypothetical protein
MLVLAIDWSGAAAAGGRRAIAAAECERDDMRLAPAARSREQTRDWLLAKKASLQSANGSCELVVGLDFAFSLPAWFAREALGAEDVNAVWDAVAADGEAWLRGFAPPPFWGRGERARRCGLSRDEGYRQTEREIAERTGAHPRSVFQLVGAGQVGTGSLRGMPILRELRRQGFAIWPFDVFALPLVVEIYPRVLTGKLNKGDFAARGACLAAHGVHDARLAARAAITEHAFDAACSALVMSRHLDELLALGREGSPYDIEGKIWTPSAAPCAGAISNSPRATTTAEPPTSTRSTRSREPSARA